MVLWGALALNTHTINCVYSRQFKYHFYFSAYFFQNQFSPFNCQVSVEFWFVFLSCNKGITVSWKDLSVKLVR